MNKNKTSFCSVTWIIFKREILRLVYNVPKFSSNFIFPLVFISLFGIMGTAMDITGNTTFAIAVASMIPGIMMVNPAMTALMGGMTVVEDIQTGFMKEMLVSPISRVELAIGKILGIAAEGVISGLFIFILGYAFPTPYRENPQWYDLFLALSLISLISITCASFGLFTSTKITNVTAYQSWMQLALFPMMFLSGAYFPLERLPSWIQWIVFINPMAFGDISMRNALGTLKVDEITGNVIYSDRWDYSVNVYGESINGGISIGLLIALLFVFTIIAVYQVKKMQGAKEYKGSFQVF